MLDVVVLPCVPVTAIVGFSRVSSPSRSARCSSRWPRSRATRARGCRAGSRSRRRPRRPSGTLAASWPAARLDARARAARAAYGGAGRAVGAGDRRAERARDQREAAHARRRRCRRSAAARPAQGRSMARRLASGATSGRPRRPGRRQPPLPRSAQLRVDVAGRVELRSRTCRRRRRARRRETVKRRVRASDGELVAIVSAGSMYSSVRRRCRRSTRSVAVRLERHGARCARRSWPRRPAPWSRWSRNAGSAIAARIPMIRITTRELDQREAAVVALTVGQAKCHASQR